MSAVDRRTFLTTVGRCGLGVCAFGRAFALAGPHEGEDAQFTHRVDFQEQIGDGRIMCGVCPRHCVLGDGETGLCRSRTNVGGVHYARGYGRPCIIRDDPIEKIPLSHFMPGAETMTIATGGCNLRCLYCQNWEQSQHRPNELEHYDLSPADAVAAAQRKGLKIIAFNYTEPIAFLEYAIDIAAAAKKAGLRVVAATGGYVEPEPLLALARYLDAITVGLKGFTEDFYGTVCEATLDPVLRTIDTIRHKTDCWLELVNLIVPTYNDDLKTIRLMAGWIRRTVGVEMPLHFSRFVPMYRLTNLPRTSVTTLEAARQTALSVGLKYAYTANIALHDGTNTYCPKCHASLIQRLGFKILSNRITNGQCPHCHTRIPGVWS